MERLTLNSQFTVLPAELLLIVAGDLDDGSLCALGLTCRRLNALLFPWFFTKHDIDDPQYGHFYSTWGNAHALRAYRCFLNANKFHTMTFNFQTNYDTAMDDIAELLFIFKRKADKITSFSCAFSDLDWWARDKSAITPMIGPGEVQAWRMAYFSMLNAVVEKGCRKLVLNGGTDFLMFLEKQAEMQRTRQADGPGNIDSRRSSEPQHPARPLTRRFLKLLHGTSHDTQSASDPILPQVYSPSKLQKLIINSDMLFSPTFLPSTIHFFENSAGTITKLELALCRCTIWGALLQSITLPHLTTLCLSCEFAFESKSRMHAADVAPFLARHPTIENLHLRAMQIPEPSTTPTLLPNLKDPILPNLTTLIAQPLFVHWLLNPPKNQTRTRQNPPPCPKLTHVTFLTQCYQTSFLQPPETFNYAHLDLALTEALLPRAHEIAVGFNFDGGSGCGGRAERVASLDAWLLGQCVDAGVTNGMTHSRRRRSSSSSSQRSPLSKFTATKRLHITCSFSVNFFQRGDDNDDRDRDRERLEAFAKWVGLFPNVKVLEVDEHPLRISDDDGEFETLLDIIKGDLEVWKALRAFCPGVEMLRLNEGPAVRIGDLDPNLEA